MIKPLAATILKQVPSAAEFLRKRRMHHYFPIEMGLLTGRLNPPQTQKRSVLLLTHHKCASVYTRDLFRELAIESDVLPVDYDYAIFSGEFNADERRRIHDIPSPELYPVRGCCFAPIRAWHNGYGDLAPYRVILMVRDPRDSLVSFYFSMSNTHTTPDTENEAMKTVFKEREFATTRSIDDYVLEKSADFLQNFGNYLAHAVGHPNVLAVTYEEMITDYSGWLRKVIDHAGFTPGPAIIERLIAEAPRPKQSENPGQHIRQVTPGDHRKKLRRETIAELNNRFADTLACFGYSV